MAYSYAEAGSDWRTWRVRDIATGTDLPDVVRWAKFTLPVSLGDSGFVYGRFDAPDEGAEFVSANRGLRLDLHRIGTDQAADEPVFALPDEPDITFWPEVTEDGRWLVVLGSRGTEPHHRVWVRDLADPAPVMRLLVPRAEASWELIGTSGDALVMITDLAAERGRVVALDTATGAVHELVAQCADTLEGGALADGRLVLH